MDKALLVKMFGRWLFLPLILSHVSAQSFSVVVPETPVSGLLGGSVTLPCAVSDNLDVRKLEVRWYRPSMYSSPALLYLNEKLDPSLADIKYQGRVSLPGPLEKGDVSLKLDNLRLSDIGTYMCHVSNDRWYDKNNVSLTIQAVGSSPILTMVDAGGGKVNVSCRSHGWLPKPSLTWRDSDGRDLNHLSKEKFTTDSSRLVSVNSWLLISPSESNWLSCSLALSNPNGETRESRVVPHSTSGAESWKGAFILTLVLLLLFIIGVGVYCLLPKKAVEPLKSSEEQNLQTPEQTALLPAVNLTIDPKETPQFLKVTNREKSVSFHYTEDDNENLEEEKIFSLCKEKFSSGKQYWEVKLNEGKKVKLSWFVGVASDEAERVYRVTLSPENGFWVLGYDKDLGVHIIDKVKPIPLNFSERIARLGVFLDCDNHTLSFYNADTQSLIHTFTNVRHKKSLYPLISPGIKDNSPITIC